MDEYSSELKMRQQVSRETNEINLLNMIESRIMEIVQIEDECKRKLPKLYHQRLPRFMRRRAASHNPNRLPKRFRPSEKSDFGTKDRKKLLKHRRKIQFRKHKRILSKHVKHKYKDSFKCLLHKWFAKRFKMGQEGALEHVPLYNNTKNQRNLYRQSCYGCAYLSLAHLIPLRINFKKQNLDDDLDYLNRLTKEVSGFTFCAQSLIKGQYEIVIHMFNPDTNEYICPAFTNLHGANVKQPNCEITLWVPRNKFQEIYNNLIVISEQFNREYQIDQVYPKDWTRVRLVGPSAHEQALKISESQKIHKSAILDVKKKLNLSFGLTIGRFVEEKVANFIYYYTKPTVVDIVFKGPEGRMLWHKLIKNKAHLVGGHRDIDRLLVADCFKLIPDNHIDENLKD